MVTRRYTKDYQLEYQLNSRGRICSKAVYKGDWFAFDAPAQQLARTRRLYGAATVLAAALWAAALCVPAAFGRVWYLMLPMAFGLIPVWLAVASLARLLTAGPKVTREHRDKTGGRFSGAGIGILVTGGIAVIGGLVRMAAAGAAAWDIAFVVLAAGYAACGGVLFACRARLSMHALPKAE